MAANLVAQKVVLKVVRKVDLSVLHLAENWAEL
jgi:hypothetical protein